MKNKTEEMVKSSLKKVEKLIGGESVRPIRVSVMSPTPSQLVVEFHGSTVVLAWLDAGEKVQRLEMHAIDALALAYRIAEMAEPKYEHTGDGVFVPKGMTKMLKKKKKQ